MKKLSRTLSYLAAFLSALTLVRPRGRWMPFAMGILKILVGSLTPFLALAGGLGALLALARKDRRTVWAGLFGAAVAARHVARVSAPNDGGDFARAFGADWRARIPPSLRARTLPRRYTPLPKDPPRVPWQRDVVFGVHAESGDPLLCDVWQPPDGTPRTGLAVIYLHGSAWHYIDKDMGTRHFFRQLAGQGHVVIDVAYTLAPKARLRAMVADVKRAIAWAKANAADYGIDPERIVLIGGSAGGQLALLAAYTPNHPELDPPDVDADTSVRAVVGYYAVVDLVATYEYFVSNPGGLATGESRLRRLWIERMEAFLRRVRFLPSGGKLVGMAETLPGLCGGTPDEVPELYHLGSPVNHVGPHCVPTLLLQGAHDIGGMLPDVRRLHRDLRGAGVTSVYVEFPDTDHGFDLFLPRWSPAAQAAIYDTERFLALL